MCQGSARSRRPGTSSVPKRRARRWAWGAGLASTSATRRAAYIRSAHCRASVSSPSLARLARDASLTLAEVKATGTEVFGNGWDEGGESLGTITITTVSTNDAKFDAQDVIVAISGGTLGPYTHFVIFDDTVTSPTDPCLALVTLNAPETIADGGAAGAIWNANGIFRWLVT